MGKTWDFLNRYSLNVDIKAIIPMFNYFKYIMKNNELKGVLNAS